MYGALSHVHLTHRGDAVDAKVVFAAGQPIELFAKLLVETDQTGLGRVVEQFDLFEVVVSV